MEIILTKSFICPKNYLHKVISGHYNNLLVNYIKFKKADEIIIKI